MNVRAATISRRVDVFVLFAWMLAVTVLRGVRLPNDFAIEHWLIDYRFGLVKRGLVGTILALATGATGARPTEQLVDVLSVLLFAGFCAALLAVGLRSARQSRWSNDSILAVVVFLSSPFIVMSAHLVGYFDNIIILLAMLSIALAVRGKLWWAAAVQALAILVHESAILVGLPGLCLCWFLVDARNREAGRPPLRLAPLLLPAAAFLLVTMRNSIAPRDVEQSLTAYLATYPFVEKGLHVVRVPHWVTITLLDSYALHQGHFLERLLSESRLGAVVPSVAALLAYVFTAFERRAQTTVLVLGVCLAPQMMHLVAWDTSRIWTYSIVCAFLVLWSYAEIYTDVNIAPPRFVRLVCVAALILNAIETIPLMDGLRDRFELTTRLLLYAPAVAQALRLATT